VVSPAHDSAYYLVVPNNGLREGNYGENSDGVKRPQGTLSCLPQDVATCP
jgi:hypothetical protein